MFAMGDKSFETEMEDEKESFQTVSEGKYCIFFSLDLTQLSRSPRVTTTNEYNYTVMSLQKDITPFKLL